MLEYPYLVLSLNTHTGGNNENSFVQKSVCISKSFKKSINHVRGLTQKGPCINLGRSLNMTTASIIKHEEENHLDKVTFPLLLFSALFSFLLALYF